MVIPAHNEAKYIRSSLDSLQRQTIAPYEIIVVDNNSSDETVKIIKQYPNVRIITESRQGSSFACFTGFEAVRGDIIGRIDADNILPDDWCEKIINSLEKHKSDAVVGSCSFYNLHASWLFEFFHGLIYHRLQACIAGTQILWGTNMGLTLASWQSIRAQALQLPQVDEDVCMSLLMKKTKQKIVWDKSLRAQTSFRQVDMSFREVRSYLQTWAGDFVVVDERMRGHVIAVVENTLIGLAFVLGPIMKLFRKRDQIN